MEFKLYLFDFNKDRIAIIQNIRSVSWQENFYGYGEIAISIDFTKNFYDIVKQGMMIVKVDELNNGQHDFCIIDYISASTNEINIRGYNGKGLLRHRVAFGNVLIKDVYTDLVKVINLNKRGLEFNLIEPIYTDQPLDNLEYSFENLGDMLNEVGEKHKFSYNLTFNMSTKEITMMFDSGVDRRFDTMDYVGYFSDKIGNIVNMTLYEDTRNFYNYGIVMGENSITDYIDEVIDGEERKEIVIDVSDIEQTYKYLEFNGNYDDFGNPTYTEVEKTYTDAEYKQILKDKARIQFDEESGIKDVISIDFTNNDISIMTYGKDFKIGDILPLKSEPLNTEFECRVSEVIYTLDVTGYNLVYTLKEER